MFENVYELSPPSTTTTRRLIEINFYLVFMELINTSDFGKMNILFDAICEYSSLDKTKMRIAVNMLRKPSHRPSKKEIYIMCRLLGLSYREIRARFGGDLRTITKYIKEYIEEEEPDMMPVLMSELHDYLIQFLQVFKKVFMVPYANLSVFDSVEWLELEDDLWQGR